MATGGGAPPCPRSAFLPFLSRNTRVGVNCTLMAAANCFFGKGAPADGQHFAIPPYIDGDDVEVLTRGRLDVLLGQVTLYQGIAVRAAVGEQWSLAWS